jgi:hypothetical protein
MATKKQTLALLLLYLFKNSRHSNFGYLRMIFLLGRIKNYYTTLYKMIELMEMLIEPNQKQINP